jgi:hypothetical protein
MEPYWYKSSFMGVLLNPARLSQDIISRKKLIGDVMKTLLKILFLGVLTTLLAIAAMAKGPHDNKPTTEKFKNVFVVKADRDLVGAKVEIIQRNGKIVAEQVLKKRKLVIDFNESKSGYYMIRIMKGSNVKEYYYRKV